MKRSRSAASGAILRFDPPLTRATLLGRRKRFFADVRLAEGTEDVAHCTNTGRMTGCATPGSPVLLRRAPPGGRRTLRWTLIAVRAGRAWVGVDTGMPNRVLAAALRAGALEALHGYDVVRTEVPYGRARASRIDILLEDSRGRLPRCYVEVKNVTLREGRVALFPDTVTERGRRHLEELALEAGRGARALLVPFVARADCDAFAPAARIDPAFAAAFDDAAARGVEVLPLRARCTPRGIHLESVLPWRRGFA